MNVKMGVEQSGGRPGIIEKIVLWRPFRGLYRNEVFIMSNLITEPETPDKILTPSELIEQGYSLPWNDESAFRALNERRYVGEHQAAIGGNWDLYWDYFVANDVIQKARAIKIIDDSTAPKDKRLWAEEIIKAEREQDYRNAFTPPGEHEERAVIVIGGKVYDASNINLPK